MIYDHREKPTTAVACNGYQHSYYRKMASLKSFISLNKIQTLFIIFTGFGVMHLIASVSELKRIQQSNEFREEKHPSSKKPVYWLSAKNPDSGYMRHVQEVFRRIGYERWDEKTGTWDVMWSYEYPFGKVTANTLKPHQLVNHFPGSGYLTSKGYLARSKSRYIPLAFSLPGDEAKFREFAKTNPDKLWVQKNNNHRGIRIKSTSELDFNAADSFIQEFVSKPYLVDGHKFDVGIYTVITSINPLLIYVLDTEWLIRYCPEKYEPFDAKNARKYVVEDDYTPTWKMPSLQDWYNKAKLSHKESLLMHMMGSGHDTKKLVKNLYAAVAELIREKQASIINSVANYPYGTRSFFEMMRFDFVLDKDLNVFAMEVNMSPNLSSGHFTENAKLYRQVVYNTLSLVGIAMDTLPRTERSTIEEEMAVIDRDLGAFPKECAKCKSCLDNICKLCDSCMTESLRRDLKGVYLQQLNRRNFKRVFPGPLDNATAATLYDPYKDDRLATDEDRSVHLWFRGKCIEDQSWCL